MTRNLFTLAQCQCVCYIIYYPLSLEASCSLSLYRLMFVGELFQYFMCQLVACNSHIKKSVKWNGNKKSFSFSHFLLSLALVLLSSFYFQLASYYNSIWGYCLIFLSSLMTLIFFYSCIAQIFSLRKKTLFNMLYAFYRLLTYISSFSKYFFYRNLCVNKLAKNDYVQNTQCYGW